MKKEIVWHVEKRKVADLHPSGHQGQHEQKACDG